MAIPCNRTKGTTSYIQKYDFEYRLNEAERILLKYPDRIPCIVEKDKKSTLPDFPKNKFLVPHDLTFGQFIYVIRKHIKLSSDQALCVFINNILCKTSDLMSSIYKEHVSDCKFLFVTILSENTFG
jgi:GABA(A) receptor-associated protein